MKVRFETRVSLINYFFFIDSIVKLSFVYRQSSDAIFIDFRAISIAVKPSISSKAFAAD